MLDDSIPTRPEHCPKLERPPAVTYIGTGYPTFDRELADGFQPGELAVIGSGSSRSIPIPPGIVHVNLEEGPRRRPWPFMSTQVLK